MPVVRTKSVARMFAVTVLLCCIGSVATAAPLEVQLQSLGGTRIRITIKNTDSNCRDLIVHRQLWSYSKDDAPMTTVAFRVRKVGADSVIAPKKMPNFDFPQLGLTDLIRLGCDQFYGVDVDLREAPWRFDVTPGAYDVSAEVTFHLKSYFDRRPDQTKSLASAAGLDGARFLSLLPADQSISSGSLRLNVEPELHGTKHE